ncbi:MAG: type I secretion system permease/ATPase [Hyphomicrobiaceae bacterium]
MARSNTPLSRANASIRRPVLLTLWLGTFANFILLVPPIYSMQVYDRVLTSRNATTLLFLTMMAGGMIAVYAILDYARSGILQQASLRHADALSAPLVRTAMRAEALGKAGSGAQAIRDGEQLRDFVGSGLIAVMGDVPWVPVFMALCFMLHPLLGLVALAGAALVALLAYLTEVLTKAPIEEANREANEVARLSGALLRNAQVVRGLGMTEAVLTRWQDGQDARLAAQMVASDRAAALLAMTKGVRMAIQVGLLCAGAALAIAGAISPGVMIAASILMGRALAPVEQIIGQWKRVAAARTAHLRLSAFFEAHPTGQNPVLLPEPKGDLVVERLSIVPPGGTLPVVKSLSFALRPGESLAVVGNSGSGKSSLAKALAGVWPATEGAVRIDSASLADWDPDQIGRSTGYLPQDIELFSGTVADNIARMGPVDDEAVTEAALAAGAHEVILRLPQGYLTPIGEGGAALSGGMRQRVGLARALHGSPRIIVLDEPNSNLDIAGEQALATALANLKRDGATVVVVTHRPHVLRHVDKILVMADGEARAFGPRDDVLAQLTGSRTSAVSVAALTQGARTEALAHRGNLAASPSGIEKTVAN